MNNPTNNVDGEEDDDDEIAGGDTQDTQEEEFTQTQNDLTQLGDLDEDGIGSASPMAGSPAQVVDPRSIPWGRLIPCNGGGGAGSVSAGGISLLPRDPRRDKKNEDNSGVSGGVIGEFMGLTGLRASDVFNEYVIGRSVKCDVVASARTDDSSNDNSDSKSDWVHAMISNRHCRIFALLSVNSKEMEVFLEDTSGNGTLVNGSTLLRRGEKRILHTGDELCLVNPAALRKKIRDPLAMKNVMSHYSYIFVNLHSQQQHTAITALTSLTFNNIAKPKRRGLVDVRQTNASPSSSKHEHMPPPHPSHCHTAKHANNLNTCNTSNSRNNRQQQQQQRRPPRPPAHRRIEDHYDLRDLLGSGTCGDVRRAIHRKTGQQRAVKIISTGGRNRSTHLLEDHQAIKAEASLLQSLHHPYIVQLIDVFVNPGRAIYLVMEMVHGGDLFDRIVERTKYSEPQSRKIMRRILSAVHYLHTDCNIVHRDLKPENILCVSRNSDIHIKLTDFGLAKTLTDDGLKTFCGTPQYFAPEVLKRQNTVANKGRYGKEADMWSLGVILYILLSGAPPFDVTVDIAVIAKSKITFRGDKWMHVSHQAKDLVKKLLVTDAKTRLNVVQACSHEWILMDDGDTHCHPLDDPALPDRHNHTNDTNGDTGMTGMTGMTAQKTNEEPKQKNECNIPTKPPAINSSSSSPSCSSPHDMALMPPPQSILSSPSPTKKKLQFNDEIISATNASSSSSAQVETSSSSCESYLHKKQQNKLSTSNKTNDEQLQNDVQHDQMDAQLNMIVSSHKKRKSPPPSPSPSYSSSLDSKAVMKPVKKGGKLNETLKFKDMHQTLLQNNVGNDEENTDSSKVARTKQSDKEKNSTNLTENANDVDEILSEFSDENEPTQKQPVQQQQIMTKEQEDPIVSTSSDTEEECSNHDYSKKHRIKETRNKMPSQCSGTVDTPMPAKKRRRRKVQQTLDGNIVHMEEDESEEGNAKESDAMDSKANTAKMDIDNCTTTIMTAAAATTTITTKTAQANVKDATTTKDHHINDNISSFSSSKKGEKEEEKNLQQKNKKGQKQQKGIDEKGRQTTLSSWFKK